MKKNPGITEILLLACIVAIFVFSGCNGKPAGDDGQKPAKPGTDDSSDGTAKAASAFAKGHDYFIFEFGNWGGTLGNTPSSGGDTTLNVIDAETGKWAWWEDTVQGRRQMLSPDGSMILYADVPESKEQLVIRLTDRLTGAANWETYIDAAGMNWSTRIENTYWALDKGLIVVDIKSVFYAGRKPDPTGRSVHQLWWLVSFDAETGEQVARYDVISEEAKGDSSAPIFSHGQYAGGRIFLNIPGYPINDFSPYASMDVATKFDIYGIDVVTGEALKVDMRGLLGTPASARFYVNDAATSIIALVEDLDEENDPRPQGGSIVKIDIASGEWMPILEADSKSVYALRGATPDGSAILYTKHQLTEAAFDSSHMVMYLDTGRTVQLPIQGLLNQLWISPSAKYAAFADLLRLKVIQLIDIDSGEMKEIARMSDIGAPRPIGFLGGLGNGQ